MGEKMLGMPVAKALDEKTIKIVEKCKNKGITPTLAIIRVGERKDDLAYEKSAIKRCEKVGIKVINIILANDCTQEELLSKIKKAGDDENIHGILLMRPLPKHLNEYEACEAVPAAKDVDGITKGSMAAVYSAKNLSQIENGFAPCTARSVLEILHYYNVNLEGKKVIIVGRSLVIGKPVSMLLLGENATTVICHSYTKDLVNEVQSGDIVVVAIGKAEFMGKEAFMNNAVVVDVGINYSDEKQKLVGDVRTDEVIDRVSKITPVPNGVGSVTTSVLAYHTALAADK